ncbi:MAG: hypothetical protein GY834_12795 [Bacteroidetes bacterium]|nr:hypothetical protein [Bacteroidota bacterium]
MKKTLIVIMISFLPIIMMAQDKPIFGIKFSGFVKNDIYFDSRQNVAVRDGHFYLYPLDKSLEQGSEFDINSKSNFNMLSIQTRLKGSITGPDAFGAKTSAVIEGAFFGHTATDINGFRLRHAFAKLNWENTELLIGQYWHAMFITECFPGTVSFNTGVPFQPFSRNPQIRVTQKFDGLKLSFAAMSQRDFTSMGPIGSSTVYLRNNVIPELNLTVQFSTKGSNGDSFLIGFGADYLSLVPRIKTNLGYATDQSVDGISTMAFMKFTTTNLTIKVEGVLGQNTTNLTMLGGYATSTNIDDYVQYDYVEYLPIKNLSLWTDIHTNGKKVLVGLFAGYTKNKGAGESVTGPYYSRGTDIDYVYRIAPRIMFNSGKMRFSGEIEYTTAAYGTTQIDGAVDDSHEVSNLRLLVGVYYFF